MTLSSVSGLMGNRGQVNYSAAKAAMLGLTQDARGKQILDEVFHADGFEPTPPGGYRALYHVARQGGA